MPFSFDDRERLFSVTPLTAELLTEVAGNCGATVIGRVLFDLTNGWNGVPAAGDRVFVVTHEPPTDWEFADTAPFTFCGSVREAVESARAHAGDRDVAVAAGEVGAQALREGLVTHLLYDVRR